MAAAYRRLLTLALTGAALLLVGVTPASASAGSQCGSVASGAWSSPSTWSCVGADSVPAAGDSATVNAGDTVSLTANTDVASLQVDNGATLDLAGYELRPSASFALGDLGISAPGAVLESTGGTSGTLYSSGANSFAQATVSNVDVVASGSQGTQFGGGGVAGTSTWSGSSFVEPAGTLTLDGRYTIDGVSPSVGGDVLVQGNTTLTGALEIIAGGTMTFAPQAADTVGDTPMLTLGGLLLSGSETVAVSQAQHTFADGELYNLLSAPAAGLAPLGTSASTGGSFGTTANGSDLYYVEGQVPAPAVEFTDAPTGPIWSSSVAVAYTLGAGTKPVGCTLDGQVLSSCGSPIQLTGLSSGSHTLIVSATNGFEQTTTATADFSVPPAPQLSLGQQNPTVGRIRQTISVPITAMNAHTVACALNGVSIPCTDTSATFASPEKSRSTLTVTVTGVDGATVTKSATVVVAWLPPTLTLSPGTGAPLFSGTLGFDPAVPANSIDCSQLNGSHQAGPIWVQFPFSDQSAYTVTCNPARNVVAIASAAFVQGRFMIPTRYGDFWVLLSSDFWGMDLAQAVLGPGWASTSAGQLTCPTVKHASEYVWSIDNIVDPDHGQTFPAGLVPPDATVTCAAIGKFGVIGTEQVLVDHGKYIQAATTASGDSSSASTAFARASQRRRARKRARRLTLIVHASGRATIAVFAYNESLSGRGARAKLRRRLAYERTLTIRRGLTRLHFGARLNPARAEIVIRGVLRRAARHRRARYGKQITLV